MQTHNAAVLAFLSLLIGFLLLLTKNPLLQIPGGVLVLAGLFAPYYENSLRWLFHRTQPQTGKSGQTEDIFSSVPRAVITVEPPKPNKEVAVAVAKGTNRALAATSSAIGDLELALSKRSSTTRAEEETIPTPTRIKVEFSGNRLSSEEMDRAMGTIQVAFPKVPIEDVSSPLMIDTKMNKHGEAEFKIRLEALLPES